MRLRRQHMTTWRIEASDFSGDSGEDEGGEGVENEGEEDGDGAVLVHSQQARRSRCFRRSKLNHKRVNKTSGALSRATLTSLLRLSKTDLETFSASFGVRLPAPLLLPLL